MLICWQKFCHLENSHENYMDNYLRTIIINEKQELKWMHISIFFLLKKRSRKKQEEGRPISQIFMASYLYNSHWVVLVNKRIVRLKLCPCGCLRLLWGILMAIPSWYRWRDVLGYDLASRPWNMLEKFEPVILNYITFAKTLFGKTSLV